MRRQGTGLCGAGLILLIAACLWAPLPAGGHPPAPEDVPPAPKWFTNDLARFGMTICETTLRTRNWQERIDTSFTECRAEPGTPYADGACTTLLERWHPRRFDVVTDEGGWNRAEWQCRISGPSATCTKLSDWTEFDPRRNMPPRWHHESVYDPPLRRCVDLSPPKTFLVRPPAEVVDGRPAARVTFRFRSSKSGSRFDCKMDAQPWQKCRSPRTYRLKRGRHVFKVRAVAPSGTRDRTPAVRQVRVK